MKYNVNDEFWDKNSYHGVIIMALYKINKNYEVKFLPSNSLSFLSEYQLEMLCQNGWLYYPKIQTLTSSEEYSTEISNTWQNCQHLNFEQKILFTSLYKVCKDCNKEF